MIRETIDKSKLPFQERLNREARAKYEKLYPNIQEMYRMEDCQMCGAHLSMKQMNQVIIAEAPPLCTKCYEQVKPEIEKCKILMAQQRLF